MTRGCSFRLSTLGNAATGIRSGCGWLLLLLEVAAVLFARSGQSFIPCGGAVRVPLGNSANRAFVSRRVVFDCCACFCFGAPGLVQQLCACATRQFSSPAALTLDGAASAAIAFMLPQPNKQPPAIHTETLTARSNRVSLMKRATFIDRSLLPRAPHCRETRRGSKNTKAQRRRKVCVTVGLLA